MNKINKVTCTFKIKKITSNQTRLVAQSQASRAADDWAVTSLCPDFSEQFASMARILKNGSKRTTIDSKLTCQLSVGLEHFAAAILNSPS